MQEAVRLPRAGIFEMNDRLKLLHRTFPTIFINGKNIMTKAKFEFEKFIKLRIYNKIYIIYFYIWNIPDLHIARFQGILCLDNFLNSYQSQP